MQRLLWASTGVKDKAYDDTRYVVDLAAPDTVNTMPAASHLNKPARVHWVVHRTTAWRGTPCSRSRLGGRIGILADNVQWLHQIIYFGRHWV